jgi:hypothetical protein
VSYRAIDLADGFDGIPVTQGYPNVARRSDTALVFATTAGVTVAELDKLTDHPSPPPPIIQGARPTTARCAPCPSDCLRGPGVSKSTTRP